MVTIVGELTMQDLQQLTGCRSPKYVSDLDFFETLAAWKCIVVPPWVLRLKGDGSAQHVTRVSYDDGLNLDKAQILLDVIAALGIDESQELCAG
jgi:hypothetical protein